MDMSPDDTATAIYLSLLGGALMLSYLLASRMRIGAMLQQAGIWVLIFMGAIAVMGMWPEIQRTITPRQAVMEDQSMVRLDSVTVGGIADANVRAVVNDGQMDQSLLGMTYLNYFDSITIQDGELILSR